MVSFNIPSPESRPLCTQFLLRRSLAEVERKVAAIVFCHRAYGLAERGETDGCTTFSQMPHGVIGVNRGSEGVFITVMAPLKSKQWYGQMLAAVRQICGAERVACEIGSLDETAPVDSAPAFGKQLARLGLDAGEVDSLEGFVDAIAESGVAIVTDKARQLASACVYRKPAKLAQVMVDVILRTGARSLGCNDQLLYGTLSGFRVNLSESQLTQFRADYVTRHDGQEYLGRLHVTLGVGHSPAKCASVHWDIQGVSGPVVFTRIGQHGRNAST